MTETSNQEWDICGFFCWFCVCGFRWFYVCGFRWCSLFIFRVEMPIGEKQFSNDDFLLHCCFPRGLCYKTF